MPQRPTAIVILALALSPAAATAADPDKPVKPEFNGAYFGRMPRAWVEVLKIDADKRLLTVRTKKGDEVDVSVRADTELRVRDSWGELADYYPGESVMLFVYPDADGNWVYPRAVQDEVQMMAQHKWWWTVDALDAKAGTIDLSRAEKDKVFRESFRVGSDTRVWKGDKPAGMEALHAGDVVLFQTRYDKGQEKRFAVELLDAKGLEAVRAGQEERHRVRLAADGLPAVVNDLDVLTGSVLVTVQWQASAAAKDVKAGDRVTLSRPGGKPAVKFEAPVAESRPDGVRHKLQLAADPAAIVSLRIGDEVRVFPAKAP
jgi:hypothetical protein